MFVSDGVSANAYSSLPAEALFANMLGILIVAFSFLVFGILSKADWRRPNANANTNDESVPVRRTFPLLNVKENESYSDLFLLFSDFAERACHLRTTTKECDRKYDI